MNLIHPLMQIPAQKVISYVKAREICSRWPITSSEMADVLGEFNL
uniref:Uncharacterized protein n=1 Tax=Arundo donax TaxID=35708 RepID=A0A0A9AP16_ARUDO